MQVKPGPCDSPAVVNRRPTDLAYLAALRATGRRVAATRGGELGRVALELHAPAAPVPELPAHERAPPVDRVMDGSAELGAGPCAPEFDAGWEADADADAEDGDGGGAGDEEPGSGAKGLRALPPCCLGAPVTSATAPLELAAV